MPINNSRLLTLQCRLCMPARDLLPKRGDISTLWASIAFIALKGNIQFFRVHGRKSFVLKAVLHLVAFKIEIS